MRICLNIRSHPLRIELNPFNENNEADKVSLNLDRETIKNVSFKLLELVLVYFKYLFKKNKITIDQD